MRLTTTLTGDSSIIDCAKPDSALSAGSYMDTDGRRIRPVGQRQTVGECHRPPPTTALLPLAWWALQSDLAFVEENPLLFAPRGALPHPHQIQHT